MPRARRLRLLAVAATLAAGLAACSSTTVVVDPPQVGWVDGGPPAAAPQKPAPTQPNIVFVLTDDLSWNLVRYMPNVQAMMRDGVTFDHYFVSDSLCCPSRSSIFTGQFPHNTGVFTNEGPDGGFNAFRAYDDQQRSFQLPLRRAGYQTAFYGKYLNLYDAQGEYDGKQPWIAPGWTVWGGVSGGYSGFDYDMALGHQIARFDNQPSSYLTDVLANKAMRFIAQSAAARQPFMTEIATFAPHSPFRPAPRDEGRFLGLHLPRSAAYARAVTDAPAWLRDLPPVTAAEGKVLNTAFVKRVQTVQAIDRMVGRLRGQLDRLGIAQNTYVVFNSDNGLHLGEHDLLQGKETAFDTDIRVPLVVTGPGVDAGRTVSAMTENVDLAPTFDSMAGLQPPAFVDGRSLLPLLHGAVPDDWRKTILVEHHGPLVNPADPDYQPYRSGDPPSYEAIRSVRYLYVEYVDGERELYDLRRDPGELHNVYDSTPVGVRSGLHRTLAAMTSCQGATACGFAPAPG